jgi:hypothetical protein
LPADPCPNTSAADPAAHTVSAPAAAATLLPARKSRLNNFFSAIEQSPHLFPSMDCRYLQAGDAGINNPMHTYDILLQKITKGTKLLLAPFRSAVVSGVS